MIQDKGSLITTFIDQPSYPLIDMEVRTYGSNQPHVATVGNMLPLIPGLSTTTREQTHVYFQYQLNLLVQLRRQTPDYQKIAINLLILTATTAFLESIFSTILTELCEKSERHEHSDIVKSILRQKKAEIKKAGFQQYGPFLEALTGKAFNRYVSSEEWKAINELFVFRNKIAHGEHASTTILCVSEGEYKYSHDDGFESLRKYILDRKLLGAETLKELNTSIFGDEITNHFIATVIPAISQITESLSREHNLGTWSNAEICFKNLANIITLFVSNSKAE